MDSSSFEAHGKRHLARSEKQSPKGKGKGGIRCGRANVRSGNNYELEHYSSQRTNTCSD